MAFQFKSAIDDLFKPPSRLQSMIDRAVRPEIHEPDIPLNLDICDLVNKKKGNYPHDAVFALLPYINGRSNGQAYLALALLDYLVKNCGHPVHFQVASREFLNDLFRRFPEFQPTLMNPVHHRILEMLQEWRLSLCRLSRYKEDLQRINDMYSLLRRKGWRFPDVDSENIAVVIGPENTLKSREEMEKEDLEAMQAKLQELLRRATPKDLREANKLMKIITGYEQSSKRPDYDKEWEKELKEIENKTKLFIEMLQNVEPNTHMSETINLLKAACGTSQHRLRQIISDMCGSGSDAEDSTEEEKRELARLTTIEETIAEGLKAYDDLRRGIKPTFGPIAASGSSASAAGGSAEKELIALDDDDAEAERPSAPPKDAAAMYKRPGYDAERVAEMQNAGAKVKELERLLRSADPQEPVSAALRKARAECTASLAMLQELAQEQKNYAQYNDNENRELARMFMMRDRIQAAIAAYEDLKNGKTPQIPVSPTQPSSNGAAKQSSSSLAAAAAMPLSPIDDLAGLNFVGSTPPLSLPMTPGMNTPGLSVPIGGTSTSAFKIAPPPSAHGQAAAAAAAMTNPSLPTSSAQARLGKATESDKKDAFDFSDLVAAAKSVQETPSSRPATRSPSSTSVINSAKPNMAQTTTWGASPDPSKSQGGGNSLIDFMS
ncbi:ARF-binding protein [Coemansia asiatica]|uniref:ARF-binding protein n=1 Tax=Coemansia asiatica TaxID=1052880 RepID=A0A9W7XH54_9FUNG|nr:ARF-binding protein [Coemansia asiatica]